MAHEADVFAQIAAQVQRQYDKWGVQTHTDHEWYAIELEEIGEVARALNQLAFPGSQNPDEVAANLQDEIVHAAAVLVAWLDNILRRDDTGGEPTG